MLSSTFKSNESAQALDDTTGIWTPCTVLGYVSDWQVNIKWDGYNSKYNTLISIPIELQKTDIFTKEKWSIRKPVLPKQENRAHRKKAILAKTTDALLGYTRKGRHRTEKVSVSIRVAIMFVTSSRKRLELPLC